MKRKFMALLGAVVLATTCLHAQDSGALIDALVKKGVLSDQEAEEIRAQLTQDYATTPAGKLALSNHITQLKLYGDARWRNEWLETEAQAQAKPSLRNSQQDRNRYRIRVGADYSFTDKFKAGFELESATDNDSANQTVGNAFGKFGINVGLLYLQYDPTDWLTGVLGKQRNPLYTTDLVWDPDINPEGLSENFHWDLNDKWSIGLTAAQFIYEDQTENNAFTATTGNQDVWMFTEQIPVTFKASKNVSIKVAPGFQTYLAGSTATTGSGMGIASGSPKFEDPRGANDLASLLLPGEVQFKLGSLPVKTYWDFAYNTTGDNRIHNVYLDGATKAYKKQNTDLTDDIAWLAGVQVGQNKVKGDWSAKIDYRQIGLGSVDPNLSDSDFASGTLNQQGVKMGFTYNFTDFLTGGLTYFNTWNYKQDLNLPSASAAGAAKLAPNNTTQRLQADIVWKF